MLKHKRSIEEMVSNLDFISDSVLIGLSGEQKIFYTDIREDNKHVKYYSDPACPDAACPAG